MLAGSFGVWAVALPTTVVLAQQSTSMFGGDPKVLVPTPAEFEGWPQVVGTRAVIEAKSDSPLIGTAPLEYNESFREPGTLRRVSFSAKVWPSVDVAQKATYTQYGLNPGNQLEIPADITADDAVAATIAATGNSAPTGAPFGLAAARIRNVWLVVSVYDKPDADPSQIIDWLRQAVTDAQQADWSVPPFDWDHAQPDVPRPWPMEPAASDLSSGWQQRRNLQWWNDAGERGPRANAIRYFTRGQQELWVRIDAYDATESAVAAYALQTVPPSRASSFPVTGIGDQATGYKAGTDPTAAITNRQFLHIQRAPLVTSVFASYTNTELSDDAARSDMLTAASIVDNRARAALAATANWEPM